MSDEAGHVYVIAGDVTKIACDAWLLPTDESFRISQSFRHVVADRTRLRGYDWDGKRVLPLEDRGVPGEPAVWLGNVGISLDGGWSAEWAAEWFGEVIRAFATEATKSLRPDSSVPLLAIPVLGTGDGGFAADKGTAQMVLLPALQRAATESAADLALVCRDRRSYSAAQRVRRQLMRTDGQELEQTWSFGDRTADLHRVARRLAARARAQELVLFLGAGASIDAGLPAWQPLLDEIAQSSDPAINLELLQRLDLRDQAALLSSRSSSRASLEEVIRARLERARYSVAQAELAALPVRESITTNYDLLFETAVRSLGDDLAVLPYSGADRSERWLLKLHGSIDQEGSIVLTRSDYMGIPTRHGALIGLVQAMLMTRHMLFVGYSLTDEDFHQLVYEVRQARGDGESGAFGTVVTLFEDALFEELWASDLEVVSLAKAPADAKPSVDELEGASRRHRIFLDLVAFLAVDLDAFILDDTYEGLLNEDELAIREHLQTLQAFLRGMGGADVAAVDRLRTLLEQLGSGAWAEDGT